MIPFSPGSTAWPIALSATVLADLRYDHPYRFVIHDRDKIFAPRLDADLKRFGLRVLRTPIRAPKANPFCERHVGTIGRECL